MRRVFPGQQIAGFQHIGKAGGHMADFITGCLLVPLEYLFIDQCARGFGQRQRRGEDIGRGFQAGR